MWTGYRRARLWEEIGLNTILSGELSGTPVVFQPFCYQEGRCNLELIANQLFLMNCPMQTFLVERSQERPGLRLSVKIRSASIFPGRELEPRVNNPIFGKGFYTFLPVAGIDAVCFAAGKLSRPDPL